MKTKNQEDIYIHFYGHFFCQMTIRNPRTTTKLNWKFNIAISVCRPTILYERNFAIALFLKQNPYIYEHNFLSARINIEPLLSTQTR